MSEWLDMGKYARYVWPALAMGVGIVVVIFVQSLTFLERAKRDARRRLEVSP